MSDKKFIDIKPLVRRDAGSVQGSAERIETVLMLWCSSDPMLRQREMSRLTIGAMHLERPGDEADWYSPDWGCLESSERDEEDLELYRFPKAGLIELARVIRSKDVPTLCAWCRARPSTGLDSTPLELFLESPSKERARDSLGVVKTVLAMLGSGEVPDDRSMGAGQVSAPTILENDPRATVDAIDGPATPNYEVFLWRGRKFVLSTKQERGMIRGLFEAGGGPLSKETLADAVGSADGTFNPGKVFKPDHDARVRGLVEPGGGRGMWRLCPPKKD